MAFGRYDHVAFSTTSGLAVAAGAFVEVRRESDNSLATIYKDADGNEAQPNGGTSFQADDNGHFAFYAAGLADGYKITVTFGSEVTTLRNQPIGTSRYHDAGTVGASVMLADTKAEARSAIDAPAVDEVLALAGSFGLSCSVASNALTIALKDADGDDPSASSPVSILFRSATAATGTPSIIQVSAANSLTISSGSTLGTSNSTPFRFWIVAFDDDGTLRLGAINCLSGVNIFPLKDDDLRSSTAEGGAGAADSAHVIYTGTAVSSKAMRVLGYLEYSSGLATAGTYASAPTKVQVFTPGVPLPGQRVQVQTSQTGASSTGTTILPQDDTIPQQTEGDEYMTQAITPTSAANLLHISHRGYYAHSSVATSITAALFQDAAANALAVGVGGRDGQANTRNSVALDYSMRAGTTSSTTFKIRAGSSSAGTTTFNGSGGSREYGGVLASTLAVEEVMA